MNESSPPDTSERNLAEQVTLARQLGDELTNLFIAFVRGERPFEDVTFETYDILQDLFVVASGDYEISNPEDYDTEEATDEQEDLSAEPDRDAR